MAEAPDKDLAEAARVSYKNYRTWVKALEDRGYKIGIRQATKELIITKEVRL